MADMKFKFTDQDYQTEAVEAVAEVFGGQRYNDNSRYRRDVHIERDLTNLNVSDDELTVGFANAKIQLSNDDLLSNIRRIQNDGNIVQSESLATTGLGRCALDVEMETGTGKTYVYIKTMFELNKRYGWSKFIVVVPSIAIREGVKKSFDNTQDHFMEKYGKKARYFVYDSSNLSQIDSFSQSADINVIIINIQAFNATGKDARRIFMELDEFQSRRPIDVIAANRPILILDEPQKMGGDATKASLKYFKPLFCLYYSATHKEHHNTVYVLDAVDAYNKKLVKRIYVKGIDVHNLSGTSGYMYLDKIVLDPHKPPRARMEIEVSHSGGIKREVRLLSVKDDLYSLSNNLNQYKGYRITDIDFANGYVAFTNGEKIYTSTVSGDEAEKYVRRIQIRETIRSHFENERELFHRGIKTLSLFFIDKVENYRKYDNEGNEVNSEYGTIFEEEYTRVLNEYRTVDDVEYREYLDKIDAGKTHAGYFSIDKKGHKVDSSLKRGSDESDDISAYDLILKDKEKLLSLDNPVRFIFSHSALREGWDNPNVFQICTLKNGSDSGTKKRQEVGRGLRLCVNQTGDRMDKAQLGENVHDINKLTVIASDGYKDFVSKLQEEISEDLYKRPTEVIAGYFEGKFVMTGDERKEITRRQATAIYQYLIRNDYVDELNHVTDNYKEDADNNALAPLPLDCQDIGTGIHELIQQAYRENTRGQVEITNLDDVVNVELNEENFNKKEFQKLWRSINHRYSYTVDFNSDELIDKAVHCIDQSLRVSKLRYTVTKGAQVEGASESDVRSGNSIEVQSMKTEELGVDSVTDVEYDLVGQIASGTSLTRRTVAKILAKIKLETFAMFKENPEEFIKNVTRLINEQKATTFVEHISYNMAEGSYDSDIFTTESHANRMNVKETKKSIQNYVILDGYAKNGQSEEATFINELEKHEEVCVYAKLPKGFLIPTPVGSYSPDWAVAFEEGKYEHVFFIAETKGSMSDMDLKPIERAKITCARELFNKLFTGDNVIVYDRVVTYEEMLDALGRKSSAT